MKLEFYDGSSWYSVATESFVNTKVFDINSNTSGSLNINRLQGYPGSVNAFLRGDGTWTLPYIDNLLINGDVSLANYLLRNVANPISAQDAATKAYVDSTAGGGFISLFGAVSGSGAVGSSILTTLSDDINKSSYQTLNFSAATSNFNLYFPNSGNNGVKLRMGRSGVATGLYGFEFESKASGSGTPIFNFNFSDTNSIANIFSVTQGIQALTFNSYLLSGLLNPVNSQDAVTKNYVDTKDINSFPITSNGLGIGGYRIYNLGSPINSTDAANKSYVDNKTFDINSNTTGQLSISRLSGYPSSSNAFLRGDGVWILPYINNLNISSDVSFANYRIVNLANPINSQDAVTKNYADTFTLSPSRISGYPSNSSYFLRGDGAWATPSGGGGSPYTGKFVFQESGYQIYIRASSNFLDLRAAYVYAQRTSAILETNSNNETCSLVMNGDFMQFINPIDTLGFIFTDEDNDPQTTYVGYIDNSGFHTSCSKDRKHSIRKKQHKNYLERLNKLSIYSYGLKYQVNPYDSDKKKKRKIRKMNELQVGVIAEEVAEIFDNATNQYKPLNKSINERPPDNPSLAVNYNTLLCYSILAIQELAKKVEFLEQKLEKAYNLQS